MADDCDLDCDCGDCDCDCDCDWGDCCGSEDTSMCDDQFFCCCFLGGGNDKPSTGFDDYNPSTFSFSPNDHRMHRSTTGESKEEIERNFWFARKNSKKNPKKKCCCFPKSSKEKVSAASSGSLELHKVPPSVQRFERPEDRRKWGRNIEYQEHLNRERWKYAISTDIASSSHN